MRMHPRLRDGLILSPLVILAIAVWTIPNKPSQLDRIESTLDETVDFLSDLHAERAACK